MRAFLVAASQSKKPANFPADCMPLLKPAQEAMAKASKAVGRGDWECHQKTVSEGLQCLSWLVVVPARATPSSYIGGQDFWANKIRVKYKKTAPAQTAFCDTFKKLIQELMPYVKEHHMAGGANDLQSKGLRKVTDDQKTYKKEYAGGAAPAPKAKPKVVARKQTVTKGEPKKTLVGKKWLVENQTKDCGVVTVDLDAAEGHKFTIYVVACYEATIVVNGKCNSVTVDACAKCQVVFDSCISSFEVVNSKSMKVQVRGTCPSVAIDKTDGILTYLSKDTLPITSFLTSKSSDMQVSFPDDNDDMVEAPIPVPARPRLKDGKPSLTTDVRPYSH
ncbi:adenylate cyclase binding protein [Aureococcus anophagefferens]|nr:adenylate cyclase binding protein [Aureococcus anophagefferens]